MQSKHMMTMTSWIGFVGDDFLVQVIPHFAIGDDSCVHSSFQALRAWRYLRSRIIFHRMWHLLQRWVGKVQVRRERHLLRFAILDTTSSPDLLQA